MGRPGEPPLLVALYHGRHLPPDEATHGPCGPDQDPAQQRCVCADDRAANEADLRPLLWRPVMRLRIIQRIGQALVGVMYQMAPPVALIGKPQKKRPACEQAVEPSAAGRVAMDDLVLQRGLPGGEPGPPAEQGPKRKRSMV